MMHFGRQATFLGVLGSLACGGYAQVGPPITLDVTSTDSIKDAARTVAYNMMKVYTGNQTGQIPGLLPGPYFWWEAGAMFGQLIHYWYLTGDAGYNEVVTQGIQFQVGANDDFMPQNQTADLGNDDQVFWAFTAMDAAELNFPDPPASDPSWLALAQAVFNDQVGRWDSAVCGGGLRWQIFPFNAGYNYKNTIATGGLFQLSARLARYTGNQTYADWADKTWDWISSTPIFGQNWQIWDGTSRTDNCSGATETYWTYNVGTLLAGASYMYNYTNGNSTWESRLQGLLYNGTEVFFVQSADLNNPPGNAPPNGQIMAEVACEFPTPQTCDVDQPSFKAYLTRWMAVTTQLAPFTEPFVMPLLNASAQACAQQCTGQNTNMCGRRWYQTVWDGYFGVGEQMSALSSFQNLLISKVGAPVTAAKGGTSIGNPAAGGNPASENPVTEATLGRTITTADKAESTKNQKPLELPPSGQLTDITSSNKKRKLSKSDIPENASLPHDGYQSPTSTETKTSSPSLPRPLPPHLLIQDSFARRSPTPDISSTAASSPSAAYAGLTLEGDSRRGESPFAEPGAVPDNTRLSASRSILSGIAGQTRSSSPAKRTRSEMNNEEGDDVGTTEDASSTALESMSNAAEVKSANKHTRLAANTHQREGSVDILAYDGDGPVEENGKDAMIDDGCDTSSNGAYLTPRSGISAPSSTTLTPATSGAVQIHPKQSIPAIDDQIAVVSKLAQTPPQDKQKGYVISKKWLDRVQARGTQTHKTVKPSKDVLEGEIGPVDNTGMNMITDSTSTMLKDEAGEPFVPLKPGLLISEDFEVIPQEAWDLIIKWYGLAKGSPVITRYCHNTTTSETVENLQYELNPPTLTILKLPDRSNGLTPRLLQQKTLNPVKILASRYEGFQGFLKRAKAAAEIDMRTKVRLWRILSSLGENFQAGMLTPVQSRSVSPAPNVAAPVDPGKSLIVDLSVFLSLQEGSQRELLVEAKDETMNDKYNGHRDLSLVGLSQDEVIVLEEQIGGPAGGEWASGAVSSQNGIPISITKNGATTFQNSLKPKANTGSGRTSPAPTTGMMTRGRTQKNGRTRGTVGLSNLGNTCYMNSALQCVRSVEELTVYFLQDAYKKELNRRNPLSHNGDVATAYAALLKELYGESNTNSSFAPRNFKQIIGKYGPSFSGYGQQDSQEFLLFLLDGLQEDLNRIHKKPYIEKPDSTDEMVNNPVALAGLADKCWEIYKARNDSVITDLFAGMYKSTVVCPVCDKVSIIFDPFNNLTLQLPIENLWSRTLFYFPLSEPPIRVDVDIDKNATFAALKEYVGRKVNADPTKLIIAEIYKCRFFKMFNDKTSISEERLAEQDSIAIFELENVPSNYPPPKKKGTKSRSMLSYNNSDEDEDLPEGDSPLAENMLVPVFNRVDRGNGSRFHQKTLFGVPSYIVLSREEARDYDSILRKVLAKVQTMTTKNLFEMDGHASDTESTQQDSDTVLMTTDDADSSTDSKVQAKSVQSEDGLVDISMRDADEEAPASAHISYPPRDPKPRPRILQKGDFIEPGLRAMFEMKYFSGTEMVPTGWNSLQEENKTYPSISSRIAQHKPIQPRRSAAEQLARRIQNGGSSSSSDEDVDDPLPPPPNNHARFLHASNDDSDDEGLPPVEELTKPNNGGFSRSNGRKLRRKARLITYSHKGKHTNIARHLDQSSSEDAAAVMQNNGSLLRLGEAIVLDWTAEAHDELFCEPENKEDDDRGTFTWTNIPLREDPELDQARQLRASRKHNGVSLGDCLDEFGKAEILSENDAWFCPRCKEHRRASKKFELWKAPDILVIHLKRFSAQGRLRDKLDVFVDFPVEGLDLSSRIAVQEENKSPVYDLFAVDNHYGGLGGGHYTAFAQNFYDKNWYEYNDSMVSRKNNPQQVVTSAAYLLFYRRRSSSPLGGPFFQKLISKPSNLLQEETASQPQSRTESPSAPAGEGKRLGDFSRNGSSSALPGAEAVHQAGSGGLEDGMPIAARIKDNQADPPGYSQGLREGEQTLESMELDEPNQMGHRISEASESSWQGFGALSDAHNEDANSSNEAIGDDDVKSNMSDTDAPGDYKFGTPEIRPMDDDTIPMLLENGRLSAELDGQDEAVDVILDDEATGYKMD